MHHRAILATLVAAIAITPALAQDAGSTAPAPAKEKKICRGIVPTGSSIEHRVCRTKSEWAAIDGNNRRTVDQVNNARSAATQ